MDPVVTIAVWVGAVLVVAVLLAMGLFLMVNASRRRERQIAEAWEAAAHQLGGTMGDNIPASRQLDGWVHGHALRVRWNWSTTPPLEIEVRADDLGPFHLALYPRQSGQTETGLGSGDAEFDSRFVILRTSDLAFARTCLSPSACDHIRTTTQYFYTVEQGRVRASLAADSEFGRPAMVEPHIEEIMRVVHGGLELARGAEALRERWAQFAQLHNGQLSQNGIYVHIELPAQQPPVTITTEHAGETLVAALRVPFEGARAETFEVCHADHRTLPHLALADLPAGLLPAGMVASSSQPARTAARIDETIGSELTALWPAWARSDGQELTLSLAGAEPDEHRIERAIALAQRLATARSDGYRS